MAIEYKLHDKSDMKYLIEFEQLGLIEIIGCDGDTVQLRQLYKNKGLTKEQARDLICKTKPKTELQ